MTGWGVLHTLLASLWAKRQARRAVGGAAVDRLYRLAYNAVTVVTLAPVVAIPLLDPGPILVRVGWPWIALTTTVQLLGVAIIAAGLLQTGALHFLGLSQILAGEGREERLVIDGVYRWVRHPLYLGGLLVLWAAPIVTTGSLTLALAFTAYLYIGSVFEERKLVAAFGEDYRSYQRRVPRFLPRPWRRM